MKMNIDKRDTLRISKILLGMLALGVCLKVGGGCYQRSAQDKKEAAEHERTTIGVLIDKRIVEGSNNKNNVIFWLNTDDDPKTAEGHCSMPDATIEQASKIASITNGTPKSLAEWREVAHPYEVSHNPRVSPLSR